jgi:hypothetical protein
LIGCPKPSRLAWGHGAEENWRFLDHLDLGLSVADQAQVEQVSITDLYHGADHLQQACDVIWGAGSVDNQAEFARLWTLLKEDAKGVDKIIGRLRYRTSRRRGRKREQLEKELTYFRNQGERCGRSRVQYLGLKSSHTFGHAVGDGRRPSRIDASQRDSKRSLGTRLVLVTQ